MPDDPDAHWHDEPARISFPTYVVPLIGTAVFILAALAYNEWRG
jgi:hypothetical protein